MKPFDVSHSVPVALLAAVTLVSGCATPALWRETAAHDWQPQCPNQLLVRPVPGENPSVIVVFEQFAWSGTNHMSRRVAWCPGHPTTDLLATGAAAKQLRDRYRDSQLMPLVMMGDSPPIHGTATPGFGIWDAEMALLTIRLDGFPPGPYSLPVTHTDTRVAARICLLPVAVAADTALVCGACVFMGMSGGYH